MKKIKSQSIKNISQKKLVSLKQKNNNYSIKKVGN